MKFQNSQDKEAFKKEQKALKQERLKKRITEIDFLRGIAIMVMVIDHAFYDLAYFMQMIFVDYPYKVEFFAKVSDFCQRFWEWPVRITVRYFVLFIFLALTGISCSFSRSNLKRGIKLLVFALLLTLVTYLFGKASGDIEGMIIFGIIHCIATAIILVSIVEFITENKWVYLAIGLVMTIAGGIITFINPGIKDVHYKNDTMINNLLKTMLGLYRIGSDSYSLLFYGGQVFIGVFLGKLLYKDRKSLIVKGDYKNNFVTFAGRHSLFIYLAHQLILPVIFGIILLIAGFTLAF